MIRVTRVSETKWLSLIDFFSEVSMKKGILDVKLVDRPSIIDHKAENSADCSRLGDGAEGLVIVNVSLLIKAFGNKACFVSLSTTISMTFDFKHPFVANNINMARRRN